MVEQGRAEEGGGIVRKASCSDQSHSGNTAASPSCYIQPLAKYEQVVASPQIFMDSLKNFHAAMGTKFMIPIIGGRGLDLHRLFVEVTSRGGIEKILSERRWKEVTAAFDFPSTATNASFVLRKYYYSLLQQYEQVYFLKAQGWSLPAGSLQGPNAAPVAAYGIVGTDSPQIQATPIQQSRTNPLEFVPGGSTGSIAGSPVMGVIDGKFESGYLVTVTVGTETLKGVLYQAPPNPVNPQMAGDPGFSVKGTESNPSTPGVKCRRRRRKKWEIRKRDPSHPKPNRSGYNFFFAEQHARLKPLHPGKDREISRMIGELWTSLQETDKAVYQEKATKDKERYRAEMEEYRQRQREAEVISDAVPLRQRFPNVKVDMVDVNVKDETVRVMSDSSQDDVSDSSKNEGSEDDKC